MAELMIAANEFKSVAQRDYAVALLSFSNTLGMAQLHEIDKALWSPEQSSLGWQLFFDQVVQIHAVGGGKNPVVGFYNPYNDTVLVTIWGKTGNFFQILEAEMLMGDWVRNSDEPLDIVPRWLRQSTFLPLAIGLSVAETIEAFERTFANSTLKNWRQALPVLHGDDLKALNYHSVTLMLNDHLLNQLEFMSPSAGNLTLATCKKLTTQVLILARQGQLSRLLSYADLTDPNTVKRLNALPKPWFTELQVGYVIQRNQGCQVFLTPRVKGNSLMVLSFEGTTDRLRLRRVDLIDYQYFYTQLYAKGQSKGGRR